ncbi:MAG TPA: hypothetical protein VM597_20380 [Gemmataceae bacterium]|nr:hypothetical protein [Gemmataceae bacterium]
MDIITITILVVAVLALAGWGYGTYSARPVTVVESGPAPGPAPGLSLLGIVGLILLVAFVVLLATGWRFGFEINPPG